MENVLPLKGIELLQKQIVRGNDLLKSGVAGKDHHGAWQNTTKVFLEKSFDKGSEQVVGFLAKSEQEMTVWNMGDYFPDIFRSQITYLGSCIQILEAELENDEKTILMQRSNGRKNNHISEPSDPFKRRYQVFVSSTYDDLKEERRHVIQALLQTKCIPTGMELRNGPRNSDHELS